MATTADYRTLGVGRATSSRAVTAAWRALLREQHPDRRPPAEFTLANARAAEINAAYREVMQTRRRARRRVRNGITAAAGTVLGYAVARLVLALSDPHPAELRDPAE